MFYRFSACAQPVITLKGKDTIKTIVNQPYSSPGATAYDSLDGDLTDSIIFSTDVDTAVTGLYVETYYIENSKGQKDYKTRLVLMLNDLKPPVIQLIGPDTFYIEASRYNSVYYQDSGAFIVGLAVPPLSSSILITQHVNTRRVGHYQVQFMAQDVAGNKAYAYRTVIVRDTKAPVWPIIMQTIYLQAGQAFIDPVYVLDAYDDSARITVTYPLTGRVNIYQFGEYDYIYTATDSSGNTSNTLLISYIVTDKIAPVISLKGDNPLRMQLYCTNPAYKDPGATAFDELYGDLTPAIQISGNVDTRKLGVYMINYRVKDSSGNLATASRTVIVEDKMPPVLTFPKDTIRILIHQPYSSIKPRVWDDSCENTSLKPQLINSNLNADIEGLYTENWIVYDASGNLSEEKSLYIMVVNSLSVNETRSNQLIEEIFPCPVNNLLNIRFTQINQPMLISLYDADGRLLFQETILSLDNLYQMDMTDFSEGIYLLNIQVGNYFYTQKVMKR